MAIITLNTLASGRFWGFPKKNTKMHVALRGNCSGPVSATDLAEVSKDAAGLLVHTLKKFFVGGCGFFVSDVISGGLLGYLGQLHLALDPNR